MDLRTLPYALDRGLDSVDYADMAAVYSLPEGQPSLVPPGERSSAQLSQIIDRPGLTQFLESAFLPPLRDTALLGPLGFGHALQSALVELRGALTPADTVAQARNAGDTRAQLRKALSVVHQEADRRAELAAYQNLLLRG